MVFIVSDQRIATENFEKGKIYKVVFLDESIFYGVCLGIGSNFVMLSGNISGYLFPLTMETASQVESIDLYTPVEPEPPVPPMTNLLQYQTGVPPFSFNTSGADLWSYYIKGNMNQSGTPMPSNPIYPQECGDLVTSGEHTGQYEIPISSGGTTTPVYLGEVQTTRKIKKLVLTGNETITLNGKYDIREVLQAYYTLPSIGTTTANNIICSHFRTFSSAASTSSSEGIAMRANGTDMIFGVLFATINVSVSDSQAVALTKLMAYLSEQYANGTPVTVWYVLATETTGIVNEPIRKIGTYADSLTSEQAGIQIPTIVGDNTLSVTTTVQPSEMQIVYKIADR